jgi:hypothetical protein
MCEKEKSGEAVTGVLTLKPKNGGKRRICA